MGATRYPLELVLLHTGGAELVDGNGDVIWASSSDDDFKEANSQEFLREDDVDDILEYLEEHGQLTADDVERFNEEEFAITEESLDDDDEDEEGDDDEDDDDEDDE